MVNPGPNVVWGVILGTGLLYEVWAIRNRAVGDTLSERTRAWFRTRTRTGAAVFTVAWVGFAAWYLVHILG